LTVWRMPLTGKSISERGYLLKMGYLRIHCVGCRRRWHVYNRDDWTTAAARTCPNCGAQIDAGTWGGYMLPSFGGMEDTNREFIRDHSGYGTPLFRVDYIANNNERIKK